MKKFNNEEDKEKLFYEAGEEILYTFYFTYTRIYSVIIYVCLAKIDLY